jgi:hypothetical protein
VTVADQDKSLQFVVLSEAWCGEANLRGQDYADEIVFGRYYREGGCRWEGTIRWQMLRGEDPAPQVAVFSDAWDGPELPGLFSALQALADERSPDGRRTVRATVAAVRGVLEGLGFADATPRRNPKDVQ